MKKVLFLLAALLLLTSFAKAQATTPKLHLEKATIHKAQPFAAFGLGLFAGACKGVREVITIDYSAFQRTHPRANPYYWNPDVSYLNKWRNQDPNQGAAYPLATTSLVWTTDAYHLLPALERSAVMAGAMVVVIGEKKPWWHYALNFAALQAGYWVGVNATYHGVYKKPF